MNLQVRIQFIEELCRIAAFLRPQSTSPHQIAMQPKAARIFELASPEKLENSYKATHRLRKHRRCREDTSILSDRDRGKKLPAYPDGIESDTTISSSGLSFVMPWKGNERFAQ